MNFRNVYTSLKMILFKKFVILRVKQKLIPKVTFREGVHIHIRHAD